MHLLKNLYNMYVPLGQITQIIRISLWLSHWSNNIITWRTATELASSALQEVLKKVWYSSQEAIKLPDQNDVERQRQTHNWKVQNTSLHL